MLTGFYKGELTRGQQEKMAKYRIGISENLLGDKRYQCQIKRFGIWWNDESFSTKERMLDYARKLEKAGHIVFNYL